VSWFGVVHRHSLIYNQCWEDPAVDRQALRLSAADRVLVITSAGCNALDYALLGARIVAVDCNPRQNHLLELKQAGIRALDFASFFELFGGGGSPRAREIYAAVRPGLSGACRRFWDVEIRLFDPVRARGGSFYYGGTCGLIAFGVRAYLERIARLGGTVERMLAAASIEEQLDCYHGKLRPRLLRDDVLGLVGSPAVMALLGVPAPQRRMVQAFPGGLARFIRSCLDRVLSQVLLRDNYFWNVYLRGGYAPESCPEYLKRSNFERLKAGLVDNVRRVTATVTDCMRRESERFTAFVLLDHMDWMAGQASLLREEWRALFDVAAAGARVIFRSGGPDAQFLPPDVAERLVFDAPRAAALHRLDRVGTYGSFHLARLAA